MSKKAKIIIDKELVNRYLNNEGTEADRKKIEAYFASGKDLGELEKVSFPFWKQIPEIGEADGYDEDRLLGKISHVIWLEDTTTFLERRKKRRWITYAGRIAASLFIPLLIFSYLQWSGFFGARQATAYSSIYSPLGARTSFHLPDGSEGWLNGGSTIQFPVTFAGKYREVQLEGEAFFDVVRNPKNPFVVCTDKIKVVALGTSFNVDAYKADKTSKVTLESGIVELFGSEDQRLKEVFSTLDVGFQFTYFNDLDSHITQEADVGKITAWKEGKLVFRDDSMVEVVEQLNRWFNVDIIIKYKALESEPIRGTFQDETLDEVLKLLQLTTPSIKVEEVGREILEDNTFGKRKIILTKR